MIEFSFNKDKAAIVFLVLIVALIFVNATLVATRDSRSLQELKDFGNETHVQIQEILAETKQLTQEDQETGIEAELNDAVLASFKEDIEWIALKEEKVSNDLTLTQNVEKAEELRRKELSMLVMMNYVISINTQAKNNFRYFYSEEDFFSEALALKDFVQVNSVLSDPILDSFITATGTPKEDIKKDSIELMKEYLVIRKQKLQESADNGTIATQFVEAQKFLLLAALLEGVN